MSTATASHDAGVAREVRAARREASVREGRWLIVDEVRAHALENPAIARQRRRCARLVGPTRAAFGPGGAGDARTVFALRIAVACSVRKARGANVAER